MRWISCSRVAALLAVLLTTHFAEGQEAKSQVPRNEFVAEILGGLGGVVQFNHLSGPYALMSGRRAIAFGFGLRYRRRVGTTQGTCIGVGLEYLRLPFTFSWDINAQEAYGIDYPSRTDTYQAERMGLGCLWTTLDQNITQAQNPAFFHLGLGMGWSNLYDFYPRFGAFTVRDPDDMDERYDIYRMTAEHRNGWVFLMRVGVGKEWRLSNFNRIGLLIYGQWSGVDDFNSGTYLAYPGTSSESKGTWQQGLNYVGVKLHYAMSYGAPKLPKQLRDQ